MATFYKVVRYYEDGRKPRTQDTGLTLSQAQAWCKDPETSSMTARKPRGCNGDERQIARWHEKQKHWFDGYTMQETPR